MTPADALALLARERVIEKIGNRDASLWKSEASHQTLISNSLGWLGVPSWTRERADDLIAFAEEIHREFDDVVVLGMGGSSLCSEVMRAAFPPRDEWPRLRVLDSTVPGAVAALENSLDLTRTLFIVASKSGTTTEPLMFQKYFWDRVRSARGEEAGRSFVAVTDPSTQLDREATRDGYRRIFRNPSDIGGRYSALSYFGMVPAAIAGVDVRALLDRAVAMANRCLSSDVDSNPAAALGAALGAAHRQGRDKVTIVASGALRGLGLWIEQLVAESTGKEGKGILPVALEPLEGVDSYGADRVFVSIGIAGEEHGAESQGLAGLEAAGHPVLRRTLTDPLDLGAEFYVWELATAIAGWFLQINPFDQPNVQESKDNTKRLLEEFKSKGSLPSLPRLGESEGLEIFGAAERAGGDAAAVLARLLGSARDGDYVALLAYIPETDPRNETFGAIRSSLMRSLRVATTLGYGPRFLHSTGQLHKGGPDTGIFIQITEGAPDDVAIPGEPFGFATLAAAQAQGDFEALLSRGRRAVRVQIASVDAGLAQLAIAIDTALGSVAR